MSVRVYGLMAINISEKKGMKMLSIRECVVGFVKYSSDNKIDIYNEFSLQHELGCFLRDKLKDYKVEFERNVEYFELDRDGLVDNNNFIKKEIDVVVYSKEKNKKLLALELKYPRNGQYPEQMYNICKDVKFLEQLRCGGFESAALLIFVDDGKFYERKGRVDGIYQYFRDGKVITGAIQKPTGQRAEQVVINGSYKLDWLKRGVISEPASRFAILETSSI